MVEMETAPLEGSGERQMVWPTPTTVQNGEVSKFTGHADGLVGICPRKHGLVASCSKPWKLGTVFEMWKEP